MAMRSMGTGSLGFGLVSVPVKMYSATESHDPKFNSCHVHEDGTGHRIAMVRRCTQCEAEVGYGDLVKGVEREDGTMLLILKEELESIDTDVSSGFEILKFVHADEGPDPLTYESGYYLAPDVGGGKGKPVNKAALDGYVLLRTVLRESGRVGIVKYTMRSKTHVAVLRVVGDVLVLQNTIWADELRTPDFAVLNREVTLAPKMVKMATGLLESMAGEYDATEYVDEAAVAVQDLINAKATGQPVVRREKEATEEVGDLLAALEASIALEQSVAAHPAGKKRATRTKKTA